MDELYHSPNLVAVYDTLNYEREDFDFYLSQLLAPPAKVDDLGCGTGTFAIELAHRGYQVVGIEPATQMLASARVKGGDAVCWIEGTVADVPETERFDYIIMTGHAFQCLLLDTDVSNLFSEVGRQLVPGGAFLFETRNPAARAWDRWTPEHAGAPRPLPDGRLVRVVHEVERVEGELVTFLESYEFGNPTKRSHSRSTLRFMAAERVIELAESRGLTVEYVWGTWAGDPFDPTHSPEIIFRLILASEEIEVVS